MEKPIRPNSFSPAKWFFWACNMQFILNILRYNQYSSKCPFDFELFDYFYLKYCDI